MYAQRTTGDLALARIRCDLTISLDAYVLANEVPDMEDDHNIPTANLMGAIKDALLYRAGWGSEAEPGDCLVVVDDARLELNCLTEEADPRTPDEVRDLIQGREAEKF